MLNEIETVKELTLAEDENGAKRLLKGTMPIASGKKAEEIFKKSLFNATLVENSIYCELVELNSEEQLEQLEVCNELMAKIKNLGLLMEYGDYVRAL